MCEIFGLAEDFYWDCGALCDEDCDDRNGGPTVRTVRLPLSAPTVLGVVGAAGLAAAAAAELAPAPGCGVEAPGLPDGLGWDSALAF
jgi:hypothetical protein